MQWLEGYMRAGALGNGGFERWLSVKSLVVFVESLYKTSMKSLAPPRVTSITK